GRLRDALGVPLPPGLPESVLTPVPDPLGDLVRRYARSHGPFTVEDVAAWLGLGAGAVRATVESLVHGGTLVQGRLRPGTTRPVELCDAEVLRR
ncbi:crosslink repair DNA glycosylase YcaQ family protein, partial [Georgenia sp. 10Sc9-8]|nr:crosslink repair DNA glycosylase YcaQ family protein [Georgenia halotolerans]